MNWTLLGNRLREKRLQSNLTQEQLALFAETSNIYISKIESGTARPTIPKLRKICEALGCSLSYMVDGVEISAFDKNAEYISKMLDGCSPYMIRMIRHVVESIVNDNNSFV